MRTLKLSEVIVDEQIQPRAAGLNVPTVTEYAEVYRSGGKMPPGVVYQNGDGKNWLSQGFHRHAGAKEAGLTELPFEVRKGGFEDAKLDAAASNSSHGLKRTNKDKQRAVAFVLELRPDWTDAKIAEHCGVTDMMVSDLRAELAATAPEPELQDSCNSAAKAKRGKPNKKKDQAKAIAKALKDDPARDDDDVAKEVKCKPALVKRIRRSLVEKGLITRFTKQKLTIKAKPAG